ncbi:MAG: hypothetical protein K1X55_14495 [Chitinophagales bacterium]|nr:hypothetical protein [Chitinophagales bacterium]
MVLLWGGQSFSQEIGCIEAVETNEIILKGSISNKYPVTIYLKKFEYSPDHLGVYSVKGWYYYDKIKEKIPLVGIYDGDLTLYIFDEQAKADSILNFDVSNQTIDEYMEHFKEILGFREKFFIHSSQSDTSESYWQNGKRRSTFYYFANTIVPHQEYEFLKIAHENDVYWQDLRKLFEGTSNFTLEAAYATEDYTQFVFSFEHSSLEHFYGICGGGIEKGYCSLKLNKDFEIEEQVQVLTESCLESVSSEEVNGNAPNQKVFTISDRNENKSTLTVNIAMASLLVAK